MALSADDISLIPPQRFGELLRERREEINVSLGEIASRSSNFDAKDLIQIEKGKSELSKWLIVELALLYDIDVAQFETRPGGLLVNLRHQVMAAGSVEVHLRATDPNIVLERYLALLLVVRNSADENVAELQLRSSDCEILAQALEMADDEVETLLLAMMHSSDVMARARRLKAEIALPDLGLLIGYTRSGSLLLDPA